MLQFINSFTDTEVLPQFECDACIFQKIRHFLYVLYVPFGSSDENTYVTSSC